jgi:hypothetical protein
MHKSNGEAQEHMPKTYGFPQRDVKKALRILAR